jgi:hypothetical protein
MLAVNQSRQEKHFTSSFRINERNRRSNNRSRAKTNRMDKGASEVIDEKKQAESETPHKQVIKAVETIGCFALGIFVFGTFFGAPWPVAVVCCGLSVMGVGVAYFMLRRT